MDNADAQSVQSPMPTAEVMTPIAPFGSQTLLIASLAFAVVAIFLLVLVRRRSVSSGSSVLLLGTSDAGKTAVLSTVAYHKTLPSHASMQVNAAELPLSTGKTLRLLDIPGHPRLRDQFRAELANARAIAFVVDASTVSRSASAVAEHLHHVLHALVSLPPSQKAPALAIIAHKSDLLKAPAGGPPASQLAVARVRTILERELERRRTARAGGVGVEGTDAETEELGGLDGSTPFRFADWEGGPVDILGASVTVGQTLNDEKAEDGLAQFREWLEGL